MERRRLLSALGLVTVAPLLDRAESGTAGSIRVDDELIASVARLTADYEQLRMQVAPGAVRSPLKAHAGMLQRLLREASLLPRQRAALLEQLGLTATMLAWLHFYDLGDQAAGRTWIMRGLTAGEESGSPAVCVFSLMEASHEFLYLQRGGDAIQMVKHAQRIARARLTPTIFSRLLAVEAEAYATLGQQAQCRRLLDEAARHLGSRASAGDSSWMERWDEHKLRGYTRACYVRLGLSVEARAVLQASAAEQVVPKRRAIRDADLAITYAQEGELDQACTIAEQSIEAASSLGNVGTVRERMTRLRPLLSPWKDEPRVKRLGELMVSVGASTATPTA